MTGIHGLNKQHGAREKMQGFRKKKGSLGKKGKITVTNQKQQHRHQHQHQDQQEQEQQQQQQQLQFQLCMSIPNRKLSLSMLLSWTKWTVTPRSWNGNHSQILSWLHHLYRRFFHRFLVGFIKGKTCKTKMMWISSLMGFSIGKLWFQQLNEMLNF